MAGGWGNPGGSAPGMGGGLTPDMLKRLQLYQMLMQNRGTGGMQHNPLLQLAGNVYGFGLPSDQMNIQRATPTPPWPPNNPFSFDMYSGQRGGPPVDFSYPPARPMVPANQAMLQWLMQQQQDGQGQFPRGGGGVSLAQLLGAPQQGTATA